MMVETAVSKRLKIGMIIAKNANAKGRTVTSHLGGAWEMVESAKTNGTMLDASLMEEIAVKILTAAIAKMTWLKSRPILPILLQTSKMVLPLTPSQVLYLSYFSFNLHYFRNNSYDHSGKS